MATYRTLIGANLIATFDGFGGPITRDLSLGPGRGGSMRLRMIITCDPSTEPGFFLNIRRPFLFIDPLTPNILPIIPLFAYRPLARAGWAALPLAAPPYPWFPPLPRDSMGLFLLFGGGPAGPLDFLLDVDFGHSTEL